MIGIIIAMENETHNFLNMSFDSIEKIKLYDKNFFKIKHKNNYFVICFVGIGKVNASTFTTIMIQNFDIDLILNIGSAGIYCNANVGDIVFGKNILYGDVDVTGFGYEINQVPKMPHIYKSNNFFIQKLKKIISYEILDGCIYTTDSFINTKNINKFNINKNVIEPIFIEMEACAIAQTCFNLKKEFVAMKVGIDKVFEPIENEEQFNKNLLDTSNKIDNILFDIIDKW